MKIKCLPGSFSSLTHFTDKFTYNTHDMICRTPRWRNGRRAVFRSQCPYGCVGSNPSLGTIRACSSVDRARPCGGRSREFESHQARHFPGLEMQ